MPLSPYHRDGCARLGIARLNAFRLNVYEAITLAYVNGVPVGTTPGTGLRIDGASIGHGLNDDPDTASFRARGFVPVPGQWLSVHSGDTTLDLALFAGHILQRTTLYEDKPAHVAYDIRCIDPTWLMGRRKVLAYYPAQSATLTVRDLIARFCRGVTTGNVAVGLPIIEALTFTNEGLPTCLTTICERIGGAWFVDYSHDLHLFMVEVESAESITDATPRTARDLQLTEDLSQVVTRVIGLGGGSSALSDVAAGTVTLPIEEPVWFSASGGVVQVGAQTVTYTGVQGAGETGAQMGFIQPPPTAPTVEVVTFAGTGLPLGTYLVALTWKTGEGETTIGPTASITITDTASDAIWITPLPTRPVDTKVTAFGVYVSGTNGGVETLKFVSASTSAEVWHTFEGTHVQIDKVPTTFTHAAPTQNTAGIGAIDLPPGSTSLQVDNLAAFVAAGWAEVQGGQVFRYTGRSGSSGAGTLTGIPASGPGSITAPVRAGTVKQIPFLTGIPTSGTGSIGLAVKKGEAVSIRILVEDTAAQTAMAARLGSAVIDDGIVESVVSDSRYTLAELQSYCQAYLTERKDPHLTLTFESRDPSLQVGRKVTVNVTTPPIAGTFRIQQMQFSDIAISGGLARVHPLKRVTATNRLYTFANLLRQLRGHEGGVP